MNMFKNRLCPKQNSCRKHIWERH